MFLVYDEKKLVIYLCYVGLINSTCECFYLESTRFVLMYIDLEPELSTVTRDIIFT